MLRKNIRLITTIFVSLTIILFQFQSILAVNELNSITFTVYSLGGSNDVMGYGTGSEWGRRELSLHSYNPGESIYVKPSDHTPIRFSVQNECQPFYCIEIGGHLGSVNGTEYTRNQISYWDQIGNNGSIDGDKIAEFLGSILTYGFHDQFVYTDGNLWNVNYSNNVDNISRYIATQLLVWETVYGYRDNQFDYVGWAGYDSPLNYIETIPTYTEVMAYYNSIVWCIKNARLIPSFMYQSKEDAISNAYPVSFDYEQGLYYAQLEDSNKVLDRYAYNSAQGFFYYDNYNRNDMMDISITKDTIASLTEPVVLEITMNSQLSYSSIVTWTSSSKQNGITWGNNISKPITGFAAFYPTGYEAPLLGSIEINKSGQALCDCQTLSKLGYEVSQPIYGNIPLEDISFSISPIQDIYYEGNVLYSANQIINTVNTNSDGIAKFTNLGVGTYEIKELANIDNKYIEIKEPIYVSLELNKKENTISSTEVEVNNILQKVSLGGVKNFECIHEGISFSLEEEMRKVVVGLFCEEDVVRYDGEVIFSKDCLIDVATPETNGEFYFEVQLPDGNYYIKELSGSELFIVDDNNYLIEANSINGYETSLFCDTVITNRSARITGNKIDSSGEGLGNASIGLYIDELCSIEIDNVVSNSDGVFEFNNLAIGDYYIKEISAPDGYYLNVEIISVLATDLIDGSTNTILINEKIPPVIELTPEPTPPIENVPSITPTLDIEPPHEEPLISNEPPVDLPPTRIETIPISNDSSTNIQITSTGQRKSFINILGTSMIVSLGLTAGISLGYMKILGCLMRRRV